VATEGPGPSPPRSRRCGRNPSMKSIEPQGRLPLSGVAPAPSTSKGNQNNWGFCTRAGAGSPLSPPDRSQRPAAGHHPTSRLLKIDPPKGGRRVRCTGRHPGDQSPSPAPNSNDQRRVVLAEQHSSHEAPPASKLHHHIPAPTPPSRLARQGNRRNAAGAPRSPRKSAGRKRARRHR